MRRRLTHPVRFAVVLVATIGLLLGLVSVSPASQFMRRVSGPGQVTIGAATDTTSPFNLASMPHLISAAHPGTNLEVGRVKSSGPGFEVRLISYRGSGLRLAGTMTFPTTLGPNPVVTPGRHPVVVSLHGYHRPSKYLQGGGLLREERAFVRAGFVVLHPDYRNFGGSGHDATSPDRPLGYAGDVLSAINALRSAGRSDVDTSRMVLFGRSMGGGVAMQVAAARPGWFRAVALNSPVSSRASDNLNKFARAPLKKRVEKHYGLPAQRPGFWRDASVVNYFDRLAKQQVPVRISHGTADRICPPKWSVQTTHEMRTAGVDVQLRLYPDQIHRFDQQVWPGYIKTVTTYFRAEVR